MSKYTVEFTKEALRQLKKLDQYTAMMIVAWVRKNLEGCENPRQHGEGLTANHSGQWRYHVGDYRLIAEIQDSRIVILILNVGHRRDVYHQ